MDAMTTAPIPTHTLNDGLVLPAIGFGTWPLRGDDAVAAVRSALDVGYTERLLDEVIEATGFTPSVNQVELHPSFPQAELVARHESLGIRTQAWSPLARMEFEGDGDDPLTRIAAAHRISPAQAVLAWHVARGIVPVPKSADPARQVANLAALEITLTPDEVAAITALGRPDGRLFDGDPETHEEE